MYNTNDLSVQAIPIYVTDKIKDLCNEFNTSLDKIVEISIINLIVELEHGCVEMKKEDLKEIINHYLLD